MQEGVVCFVLSALTLNTSFVIFSQIHVSQLRERGAPPGTSLAFPKMDPQIGSLEGGNRLLKVLTSCCRTKDSNMTNFILSYLFRGGKAT